LFYQVSDKGSLWKTGVTSLNATASRWKSRSSDRKEWSQCLQGQNGQNTQSYAHPAIQDIARCSLNGWPEGRKCWKRPYGVSGSLHGSLKRIARPGSACWLEGSISWSGKPETWNRQGSTQNQAGMPGDEELTVITVAWHCLDAMVSKQWNGGWISRFSPHSAFIPVPSLSTSSGSFDKRYFLFRQFAAGFIWTQAILWKMQINL